MFSMHDLYDEYRKRTSNDLKELLEYELKAFWGKGYNKNISSLRKCILLTEKYLNEHQKTPTEKNRNGEVTRASGEPYLNHVLRVALILVHEHLFDTDVLFAAVMHDLFEDTTYTYQQAAEDFNPQIADLIDAVSKITARKQTGFDTTFTPQEIDYSYFIQRCGEHPMAYYIKFADRIDNLMTLDAMPIDKQIAKIEETEKYLLPLAGLFGAKRLEAYMENGIFKARQQLKTDGTPNDYERIDSRLTELRAFPSTKPAFNKLRQAFSIGEKLFREVRILRPTVLDISRMLSAKKRSFTEFRQEDIAYDVYFITNQDEAPPALETIVGHFLKCKSLRGFYIHLFTNDGFEVRDELHNRYVVHVITGTNFNRKINGSTENVLTVTDPWTIDDDLSSNERIAVYTPNLDEVLLVKGSTVIDFAFRIHKEIGARMLGAKVNGRFVPFHRQLQPKDQVEIITSNKPVGDADVNWLLYAATKNAKREICKLVSAKMQAMAQKIERYETLLEQNGLYLPMEPDML